MDLDRPSRFALELGNLLGNEAMARLKSSLGRMFSALVLAGEPSDRGR